MDTERRDPALANARTQVNYAAELRRYAAVLGEAAGAVGLRKDAAAYLRSEQARLENESAIVLDIAMQWVNAKKAGL